MKLPAWSKAESCVEQWKAGSCSHKGKFGPDAGRCCRSVGLGPGWERMGSALGLGVPKSWGWQLGLEIEQVGSRSPAKALPERAALYDRPYPLAWREKPDSVINWIKLLPLLVNWRCLEVKLDITFFQFDIAKLCCSVFQGVWRVGSWC